MSTENRRLLAAEKRLERLTVAEDASTDLSAYVGRPVAFAREQCGFTPYAKQVEVIESAFANKWTVVRGPHAAGKDATLAPIVLYAAYVLGMLVLVISATERQLLGQTWREIRHRHEVAKLPGRVLSSAIEINGERRIHAMTSGSTSSLTGWHDKRGVLIVISEAQGESVEQVAFDAAIANATDDNSRIIVVGNPVKPSGRFYEVHQRSGWNKIHIAASDHPNITTGNTIIPGGPSRAWIESVRTEYGEQSPYYTARVLGEFPAEGSVDGLLRREWLQDAFDRHDANALAVDAARSPIVLSLDVARYGNDSTCLAIVQGPVVRELIVWRNTSVIDTCETVLRHAGRLRLDPKRAAPKIIVDEPGLGGGAIDYLRSKGARVVAYNGSHKSTDERYFNRRSEDHWRVRVALESGRIALPRDEKLEEEGLAIEWQLNSAGKIQVLSKDTVRASISRSPDRFDAVVMGLAHSIGSPDNTPIVAPYAVALTPPCFLASDGETWMEW